MRVKRLYDILMENIKKDALPIWETGEKKYVRLWTDFEPIREHYMIISDRNVKYYEMRKYTDETMLSLDAIYSSNYIAMKVAEEIDGCKNIEIYDYDYYKDARKIESMLIGE